MDSPISRAEFNSYKETCESEHEALAREDERQNERLKELEVKTAKILDLAASVEQMLGEPKRQGNRIETLESRDGEKWRKTLEYIGFAILGAVIAAVFAKIGF